jgi:hypothetical protein
MNLKTFEEYVKLGVVKKQRPNIERSRSLKNEAGKKRVFFNVALENIPKQDMSSNFIVESCYDILLELLRAKMLMDGFNAGNSHEAEVSYLRNLKFPEADVVFMNELRYYRNGIKYYGKTLDEDYAYKVRLFMTRIEPRLLQLLKEL